MARACLIHASTHSLRHCLQTHSLHPTLKRLFNVLFRRRFFEVSETGVAPKVEPEREPRASAAGSTQVRPKAQPSPQDSTRFRAAPSCEESNPLSSGHAEGSREEARDAMSADVVELSSDSDVASTEGAVDERVGKRAPRAIPTTRLSTPPEIATGHPSA